MNSIKPVAEPEIIIPDILDPDTKKGYVRGEFLGKGQFAKCYELKDLDTKQIFAVKIVSKQLLTRQRSTRMNNEICIHRSLVHKHVVRFHSSFEDSNSVYVVLELCKRRSLMELHKRRKAITEPEARYFMNQLLLGLKHLHENKIVHRNLKLDSLFLNEDMELKIGDFGLATKIDSDGGRKKTLCGTPNYIAPKVLCKEGYEADIWSVGCILYTLLVGHPPFETQSLKDTYSKIKKNEFHVPSRIGPLARTLIIKMLQADPSSRPIVDQCLNDDFMTEGNMPSRMSWYSLIMPLRLDPRLHNDVSDVRRPLGDKKPDVNSIKIEGVKAEVVNSQANADTTIPAVPSGPSPRQLLRDLQQQLLKFFASKPNEKVSLLMDEAEDPAAIPMVWVSKWNNYSDKYGFAYELSDDTIGVHFNDLTQMLLHVDGKTIQYVDRYGIEKTLTLDDYTRDLDKKMQLLAHFNSYMKRDLFKIGARQSVLSSNEDELFRAQFFRRFFRTSRANVMHFANGTLQVDYFKDCVKIILCPLMGAVSVIDIEENFRTFRLTSLAQYGCSSDLLQKLKYVSQRVLPYMLDGDDTLKVADAWCIGNKYFYMQ